MEQTDSCQRGRGRWGLIKEGEGVRQRTSIHGPCTWMTAWGLTGNGVWTGRRGARGENWDNCNRINNKVFK